MPVYFQPVSPRRSRRVRPATRAEFAIQRERYRRRTHGPLARALLPMSVGGLAVGVGLMELGDLLGWPDRLDGPFFFLGWGIMLSFGGGLVWNGRRAWREAGVACGGCGEALLSDRSPQRAEIVMVTGRCPNCGAVVLAADE